MSDMHNDKRTAIFDSLDTEDRLMIKKLILNDKETLKGITFKPIDFDTAIMREEPMIIVVPQNIVEKLRDDYFVRISKESTNNDEQVNEAEMVSGNDE